MTYLDACAGIGGFRLALDLLGVPVTWHGFSEVDKDAIAIYKAHWPEAADLGDLARWREWGIAPGWLDILSCGFPCPPFSVAGKRLGGDDPRNLWPAVAGAIRGLRPRVVMLENVPGILAGDGEQPAYFGRVLGDLAEAGYDAEWEVLSAREVGASHRRERVFVVGIANGQSERRKLGNYDPLAAVQEGYGQGSKLNGAESRDAGSRLAHADSGGSAEQEGEYQTLERNEQPDDICGDVAVPRRGGRRADDEGQRETGRGRATEAGGLVGDAECPRWTEARERCHEHAGAQPEARGGTVGDAGGGRHGNPKDQVRTGWDAIEYASLPLFPPGPTDAEGWRRVLAVRPELAPAVAGRLNPRFVEWLMGYPIGWCGGMKRSAALKALGNAVVPLCVAEAVRRMSGARHNSVLK